MVPVDHSDGSPRKIMCTSIGLLYEWYVRVSVPPTPSSPHNTATTAATSPSHPFTLALWINILSIARCVDLVTAPFSPHRSYTMSLSAPLGVP
jgi:hypothetical protein